MQPADLLRPLPFELLEITMRHVKDIALVVTRPATLIVEALRATDAAARRRPRQLERK